MPVALALQPRQADSFEVACISEPAHLPIHQPTHTHTHTPEMLVWDTGQMQVCDASSRTLVVLCGAALGVVRWSLCSAADACTNRERKTENRQHTCGMIIGGGGLQVGWWWEAVGGVVDWA